MQLFARHPVLRQTHISSKPIQPALGWICARHGCFLVPASMFPFRLLLMWGEDGTKPEPLTVYHVLKNQTSYCCSVQNTNGNDFPYFVCVAHVFTKLTYVYLSIHVYLSILSIDLLYRSYLLIISSYLSINQSINQSIKLSIYLSIYIYLYLSITIYIYL